MKRIGYILLFFPIWISNYIFRLLCFIPLVLALEYRFIVMFFTFNPLMWIFEVLRQIYYVIDITIIQIGFTAYETVDYLRGKIDLNHKSHYNTLRILYLNYLEDHMHLTLDFGIF